MLMEPMDFSALYMQYRETDRDCALLHYRLQNHKPYEKELFLPTKETMEAAWKEWKSLKERVESLEEPDQVFALEKPFAGFSRFPGIFSAGYGKKSGRDPSGLSV